MNLQTVVPAIRSSDAGYLGDPFRYFLARRLGFSTAFSSSDALSHGTWFHTAAEAAGRVHDGDALSLAFTIDQAWEERLLELTTAFRQFGVVGGAQEKIIKQEQKYRDEASVWYQEATHYQIPRWGTVEHWLNQSHIQVLGRELLALKMRAGFAPRIAQLDLLLYNDAQRRVYIWDWKTSSYPPWKRAETCPIEFQCHHYLDVVRSLMPLIREMYGLPKECELGGMMHAIVQKPTIRMAQCDRPHTISHKTISRGPNKGEVRAVKNFTSDEPSPEFYCKRVRDWYRGEGEYLDLAPEWALHPPIDISTTSVAVLQGSGYPIIEGRLQGLAGARLEDGVSFFKNPHGLRPDDPFRDFYLTNPDKWEQVMLESRIIVKHRDPHPLPDHSELRGTR